MSSAQTATSKNQGGIQSLEIGLSILDVLIEHNEPMMLKDIAQAMQMHPAKMHRYLVSLIRKKYARQLDDGRYKVGERVNALAYTGFNQNNTFERLKLIANEIKDLLNCGVQIAKWFNEGPVVIHLVEPDSPISIITRIGSRMPLTTSATGRLFASYQPENMIKPLVSTEWQNRADSSSSIPEHKDDLATNWQDFTQLQTDIRKQGYAAVTGVLFMGINAISIPVFLSQTAKPTDTLNINASDDGTLPESHTSLEYAVTVIGTTEQLPASKQHQIANKIIAIAERYQMI
ncbi:IclR family transcriptional regulator [Psychrobacter sp. H8-1]|uniref:IclR family transcriptional regulator n=1 Tax=Psychrobacter sp. H8-1 TaxID=2774129 RepID=UPI00191B761A|nr:IclR family transcriptional regulator [Psychrobacter sp. H8-1]